ncbi:hypothetical protein Rhopal_001251-T1 [Rhodotorula paludigena]|uniref:AB hydrolase-1 domain-containing protein n=1 Tax=Rhodotorula paludigena TaxID=86838 RepID=A0AAV5GF71_9BASI|nr:hypothetical protein Rhopal_001251-T1 [Rhodotorula paludigena]
MLAYSLFERHDGYAFAYKVLGRNQRATPLVLVHGLSAVGLVDWLPLAQSLAEHRPVLIFDNRGIGASTVPRERADEPYDVRDMARDVVELVNHLGWKEIDLLGFSMGGMIAQTVLVSPSLPFKIRHLVLAATSAKPAHSDLLQAIPSPPPGPMSYEQKVELVKPFIYVGYDPAFVQNPQNKPLLDRRIRESVETRRPARTVRSVYYSEAKYILRGLPHAQLLSFEGIGHMWYDYFDVQYWTTLLHRFLSDQEVASLVPPAQPSLAKL